MIFIVTLIANYFMCIRAGASFQTYAPIPTSRRGAVGGILIGKSDIPEVWVTGGSNSELPLVDVGKSVQVYNSGFDAWRDEVPLLVSRSDHGAAPLNGSLYVGGGMTSCDLPLGGNVCNISAVERYSYETAAWTEIAPLNVARRGLVFASDEEAGIIYAVGGMNCFDDCYGLPVEYLTTVEAYSIETGVWSTIPPMPTGRRDLGVAVIGSKLYAVGGCGGDGSELDYKNCEPLDVVEMYDPTTQMWSTLKSLPIPRHGFAMGIYGSQLIVAGGSSAAGIDAADATSSLTPSVLSYVTDSFAPSWFSIADMPDPREGLVKGYNLLVGIGMFLISGSSRDVTYTDTNELLALMC